LTALANAVSVLASGLGGRSSYPLISAARRSSGWTPVTPLWMLPAPSRWTGGGDRVTVGVPASAPILDTRWRTLADE